MPDQQTDAPLCHFSYFLWVSGEAFGRDNVPQVTNLLAEQLTLGWFQLQVDFMQPAEHLSEHSRIWMMSCPRTMTLSRYNRHVSHCSPTRTLSMSCWNVAGTLQSPNGIAFHSKRPSPVAEVLCSRLSVRSVLYTGQGIRVRGLWPSCKVAVWQAAQMCSERHAGHGWCGLGQWDRWRKHHYTMLAVQLISSGPLHGRFAQLSAYSACRWLGTGA